MTINEFSAELSLLAASFDHTLRPEKLSEWFKDFGFLYRSQLHLICELAKRNLERFPSIKYFHDQIREQRLRPVSVRPISEKVVIVECKVCGGSRVMTSQVCDVLISHGKMLECINGEHWECKRQFDPKEILRLIQSGETDIRL
jgi:hypothetical protein